MMTRNVGKSQNYACLKEFHILHTARRANKGHGWIDDKHHHLKVDCYQPGLVTATKKPAIAMVDSENN